MKLCQLQSNKKFQSYEFLYYSLVSASIFLSLFLIFKGLADPFGELLIFGGTLSLLLFPLLFKILFTFLFKQIDDDKS